MNGDEAFVLRRVPDRDERYAVYEAGGDFVVSGETPAAALSALSVLADAGNWQKGLPEGPP